MRRIPSHRPRTERPPRPPAASPLGSPIARIGAWWATALLIAGLLACARAPETDPRLRTPTVHFDGPALQRLAAVSALLESTPLGLASLRALEELADCGEVFGRSAPASPSTPPLLPPSLGCAADSDDSHVAWARARRGEADGWLAWPIGDDGALELRIEVDARGGLELVGTLWPPTDPAGLDLLLPGDDPPADSVLDPRSVLMHAHGRPAGGLGLARLVPSGGQADRLFALKGRLLEGALLRGTWEIAFVAPQDGGTRPLPVVALHHRGAEAIERALDEALTQLEATWPIRRAPRRLKLADGAEVEGGCYAELPLLPELAPCWAVTSSALLVGYRAAALEAARGRPSVASGPGGPVGTLEPTGPAGTRLSVHLDRLHALDRRRERGEAQIAPGALYRRLEVELRRDASHAVTIHARLQRSDA